MEDVIRYVHSQVYTLTAAPAMQDTVLMARNDLHMQITYVLITTTMGAHRSAHTQGQERRTALAV